MVIINCHVGHGKRVKEYVPHPGMEYVRALDMGPVIVVGDFNYGLWRRGAETEMDGAVGLVLE